MHASIRGRSTASPFGSALCDRIVPGCRSMRQRAVRSIPPLTSTPRSPIMGTRGQAAAVACRAPGPYISSTSRTSRLYKRGGPSSKAPSLWANSVVAGSFEFFIASS